jgi:uncharacterized protein (DUF58 family)
MTVLTATRTKAKPGPGPTPEALVRALDLTVGRRVRGLFPGEHRARELGSGLDLAQIRPYEPGDDVRRIDWNVTARTSVPHVRVHIPERAVTAWLVLDVSPSMAFGTADRRKADVAEGVAIALGHLATQRGNRLGLVTFGGSRDRRLTPMAGRRGMLGLLLATRTDADDAAVGATNPAEALRLVTRTTPRGALVAVVSDFRGPRDWRDALAEAAARHHVIAVEIRDPREGELPDVGQLTFIDAETGREVRVDTSSRRLRERFQQEAGDERTSLAVEFRRLRVAHVVLSTSGSWLRSLAGQLRLLGIRS